MKIFLTLIALNADTNISIPNSIFEDLKTRIPISTTMSSNAHTRSGLRKKTGRKKRAIVFLLLLLVIIERINFTGFTVLGT